VDRASLDLANRTIDTFKKNYQEDLEKQNMLFLK